MKIYIATSGEYSDYHICAVFTDQKQAVRYCALHEYELQEWETESKDFDTEKTPKMLWRASFNTNGELLSLYEDYLTFREINDFTSRYCNTHAKVSLDVDIPKEKAKKIICDKLAQWKYEEYQRRG